MAIIKNIIFVIYCVVSLLSSIHCQLNNDTALVWSGRTLDSQATFGVTLGNPSVYLLNNSSTDSYETNQFEWLSFFYQSISNDARTNYVGISEINFRALLIFDISDIWNKTSNIRPKYTFESFPLSSNIPGLAFASNLNLLYWVDATFQYIGVVDFTTSQWTKLVIVTPGTPSSIAVHERQRLVFWSVLADKPKIERSNLFGDERTTIVDVGLTQPVSLVIDKQSEKLFWLDGNLKRCDFDGSNIMTYELPNGAIYSTFTIYKDIFIFASSGGDFHNYKISPNNVLSNYSIKINPQTSSISSVSLDSMEYIDKDPNPCTNNPCDHLCFPINKTNFLCNCSFGFSLGSDGKTCNPAVLTPGQSSLLVGDSSGGKLYQVDPTSGKSETILNLNIQSNYMTQIAYYLNESIYYIQQDNKIIMHHNISSRKTSVFYNASSNITDIVVDQKTGNLYVANLNGQIYTAQNGRIIIDDRKLNIHKLFIHRKTRRFFYSDCAQTTVVEVDIETNMKKNTIQTGVCVDSMDFDFDYNWAYYGDNGHSVWRQDLNNPTKNLLLMFSGLHFIWDIASDKDFLYVVQYSHDIIKLDKKSFTKTILIEHTFRNASEIIYINKSNNLLQLSFRSVYLLTSMFLISTQFLKLLY